MMREAVVAIALSIRYLVQELSISSSANNRTASEVLLYIDEHLVNQSPVSFSSFWPESFSSRCKAWVYKLAKYLKDDLSTSNRFVIPSGDSNPAAMWPLLKLLKIVTDEDQSISIRKVIQYAFFGYQTDTDTHTSHLFTEVTKAFIWACARNFDYNNITERDKLNDAVDGAVSFFDVHLDQVSCAEIYAITAVALYSEENCKSHAKCFLREALRRCSHAAKDLGVTSLVYCASIDFSLLHFRSDDQEPKPLTTEVSLPLLTDRLPSKGYDAIAQVCDQLWTAVVHDEHMDERLVQSVISLLTKAILMLDFEGHSVSSTLNFVQLVPSMYNRSLYMSMLKYAHGLNLLGAELYEELRTFLYGIKLDEGLPDGNYMDIANKMSQNLDQISEVIRHQRQLDNVSTRLCSEIWLQGLELEVMAHLHEPADLTDFHQHIQLSLGRHTTQDPSYSFLWFVYQHFIISCYTFLFAYYERTGYLLRALTYLQLCCDHTQTFLKTVQHWQPQNDPSSQNSEWLHRLWSPHTFILHLSARFGNMYMHLSSLYRRLGNPRKAMNYSLWSAETLGALPNNFRFSRQSSIIDLFAGFAHDGSRTYRQTRSVRACIESFLLSQPFASADRDIVQLAKKKPSDIGAYLRVYNQGKRDIDWLRETAKDLLTREFYSTNCFHSPEQLIIIYHQHCRSLIYFFITSRRYFHQE